MAIVIVALKVILGTFIVSAICFALIYFYSGYAENVDKTPLERFCNYFENKGKQLAEKRNRRDKE